MKKKLIILVCLIGFVTIVGLSAKANVEASYEDVPYAESSVPTP